MKKIHVKAVASEFKFATLMDSDNCIAKHKEYEVTCKTLRRNLGFFRNTYDLYIEGSKENVNLFLGFLRMEGFKIKKF